MEFPRAEHMKQEGFSLPKAGRKLDSQLAAELKAEFEMNPILAAELLSELGMGISFDIGTELEAFIQTDSAVVSDSDSTPQEEGGNQETDIQD